MFLAIFVGVSAAGLAVEVTPERAAIHGVEGPPCLVRGMFGDRACPGCGLTRSTAFVLQGGWRAAWRLHPGGFVIATICGIGIFVQLAALRRSFRQNGRVLPPEGTPWRSVVRFAILLGVVLPWVWRALFRS